MGGFVRCGFLGGMWMLMPRVDFEFSQHRSTQWAVRKHSLYGLPESALGFAFEQGAVGFGFETAGVAGVAVAHCFVCFVSGEHEVCCIDDDDVVSCIDVGGELRFMFPPQECRDVGCKASQHHASAIDEQPATFYFAWFC